MLASILYKFRDAAQMGWEALDETERRYVVYCAIYIAASVLIAVSKSAQERNKQQMLNEVRAMLEERNGRAF